MFVGVGTLINIVAIIAGAALGVLLGNKMSEKTRNLVMDVLGAITLIAAAGAIKALWDEDFNRFLPDGSPLLVVLASLLVGGLLGSLLEIEDHLEVIGIKLKARFDKDGKSPFVEGFVSASLLFVIGPSKLIDTNRQG